MKTLGAILAGGGSRRFGSDKAAAWLDGRALIDHVAGRVADYLDAGTIAAIRAEWLGDNVLTELLPPQD